MLDFIQTPINLPLWFLFVSIFVSILIADAFHWVWDLVEIGLAEKKLKKGSKC